MKGSFRHIFITSLLIVSAMVFSCTDYSSILIDAPENLAISDVTSSSATLTWDSVYGSINYAVYINTENSTDSASYLGDSSTTGVNISGLDSYTTYYFWVYAKSIGGKGKPSSAISAQTVIG
ncbi:MAG: fibronectin type III domain-containing protein, partial [Treponemataceae bacterium]|nr:fibronectin type III domain-containing protein [Treponemataceae bacterium]